VPSTAPVTVSAVPPDDDLVLPLPPAAGYTPPVTDQLSDPERQPICRVLYIEDDEANIRLVERIVQLRPRVALVAGRTGGEGLRLAQDIAPSLILLDRRLPDMTGNQVLERLKSAPVTATIPVLILSGDLGAAYVGEALRLGAVGYLAKPFDINELLAVIDKYCPMGD
jgi:CheY-like chemotaxis protein